MANEVQKLVFFAVCSVVCRPTTAIKRTSHIEVSKPFSLVLSGADLVFTDPEVGISDRNCSPVRLDQWNNDF